MAADNIADDIQAYNHSLMERGEDAAIAETLLRPIIDRMIREKVINLVGAYRANEADHDTLLGKVAEISALETLLSELDSWQRQGIIARGKELGNATQETDSSIYDS